jgi:CHASE2 domain-containing sensor protein
VTLVAIDQTSAEAIGAFPWSNAYHARVIDNRSSSTFRSTT